MLSLIAGQPRPARRRETRADRQDSADLPAYEAAKVQAGHDARAHVRLALWCESHGMSAERMKHLAMAVLYDPSNALARGLMGLVAYQGKWERPEASGSEIQDDPAYHDLIREYLERRAQTARKPDAQARLAAWCEQKGLKEQAIAHYSEAVRLDPSREAAWRHLGYKKQGDRWVKAEELAAERLEAERQRHADKQWEPKLKRLREGLEAKDAAPGQGRGGDRRGDRSPRRADDLGRVRPRQRAIADRRRADARPDRRPGGVQRPGRPGRLQPLGRGPGRAIETLARRDPRDVIGRLIGLVRKPFKYEVRRPGGPGTDGRAVRRGRAVQRPALLPEPADRPRGDPDRIFAPSVPFDPYSVQNQILVSAAFGGMTFTPSGSGPNAAQVGQALAANPQNAAAILKNGRRVHRPGAAFNPASNLVYDTLAAAAYRDMQIASAYQAIEQTSRNLQQRLAQDIQTVETTNTQINELNGRVLPVLKMITGQDFGAEPEKWKTWWTDQLGYVYQSNIPETKPTLTDISWPRSRSARATRPASRPARWSPPWTARGRSNRSRSATASCRRTPRPAR